MNKKNKISASSKKTLKLKVLAKEKEGIRRRLAVTAGKLRLKAEKLAVTAKKKESVRRKLAVRAKRLPIKAEKLAVTAKEKESIRRRLAVTAEKLAITAKEKESIRRNLAVTARQLARTAKEKESVRNKLVVTAEKLAITAKERESIRQNLAVTAKEKESVRNKLVVTAEKLAVTAKEKESVRRNLAVTAKEKESVRNKLVVTAKKLAITAKEKESVRNKLVVTAEKLAVTAKEKESVRRNLAVTAKEKESVRNKLVVTAKKLAITAKEKESVRNKLVVTAEKLAITAKERESIRQNLAVTAKEKESIRRNLAVTAEKLAITAKEKESIRQNLAVTAKEKESIRQNLAVTAKELAVTAKEKESIRQNLAVTAKEKESIRENLAVTAKEKESIRQNLAVTAEKLAVTAIEKETMIASIGEGLIATDEKGIITVINNTAEKLLDIKSEEVIGKVFSEVIPMEDEKGASIPPQKRPMIMALTAGTTTSTTTEGASYYYVRKDKTKFPVAMVVTPIILDSKVIGTIEVFRDITREKEVDRAKSEFVSLASHQLRTPPTSMKWFLEMLLSGEVGELNEKQREYFEEVYRNNQRMITLVNTLLNVSRIDLGVFAIQPEPTDVVALTKGIIEEMNPQIHEKELRVNEKYSKNLQKIFVDPKLISIAIQDVVSNAVKYTPPKGTIDVEISLKQNGESIGGRLIKKDSLVVFISDTGYGIPKDQQDKIFTKLFRADNVKEKDTDGTGLGLYLAKSIIDHAQGNIWFESELNKGSKFYLTIPLEGMKKKEGITKITSGSTG